MQSNIFTAKDFKTGRWSGGSTTELYISPADAQYKALDFDVRISSAKVEVETSTFTNLPQVHRQLMILDGSILLSHSNRYSKTLKPFDYDTFEGDWNTSSEGLCTDFNVMTRGNAQSHLEALLLSEKEESSVHIQANTNFFFVYLYKGNVELNIGDMDFVLEANQLLVLEDVDEESINVKANDNSELILVSVTSF